MISRIRMKSCSSLVSLNTLLSWNKTEKTAFQSKMPGKIPIRFYGINTTAMHLQCTCNAPAIHLQCTCNAPAMHLRGIYFYLSRNISLRNSFGFLKDLGKVFTCKNVQQLFQKESSNSKNFDKVIGFD